MVPAGEPGHGDDVADDGGGDDRPDAGHLGEAGAGCRDRGGELLLDPRRWASRWRMSASSSAASSQRAWATAPAGATCSRILAAWPAVISSGTPPGTSSHSTAWSRQTTWLRVRERSRCRLARTFSTTGGHRRSPLAALGPQRRDRHRPGIVRVGLVRVAGLQQPDPGSQLGLHIQHPLAGGDQLLGQQPPSPRAPSTAQVRSGQACAQATSFPAWSGQARTRSLPSGSSAAPTATAVCEPLCGSVPIITAISALPSSPATRRTAAGMPYTGPALGARPSFEPRHGKVRRSRHIDLKPGTRPAGG